MTRQSARAEMNDELQRELRDLLCLAVDGDHTRWVLSGEGTAELTEWLSEAIAGWRAWADKVARYLADRGVAPDGRVRSLAKDLHGTGFRPAGSAPTRRGSSWPAG